MIIYFWNKNTMSSIWIFEWTYNTSWAGANLRDRDHNNVSDVTSPYRLKIMIKLCANAAFVTSQPFHAFGAVEVTPHAYTKCNTTEFCRWLAQLIVAVEKKAKAMCIFSN